MSSGYLHTKYQYIEGSSARGIDFPELMVDMKVTSIKSDVCQDFIKSIVFLDNKRPITVALLSRINLRKVAELLGVEQEYKRLFIENEQQMSLL